MKLLADTYFKQYNDIIGNQIENLITSFNFVEKNIDLGYTTQASAVYSSNIEGNSIDLNSYMNYKLSPQKTPPHKEIQEIENLVLAYTFAQSNPLTEKNLLQSHKIFAQTLVIKSEQGNYRKEKVGVFDTSGLVYLAIEPEHVQKTMRDFFHDVELLIKKKLSTTETLYFASFIHLLFAHIHPFRDGNGRAARLLEKWFLAEKLGKDFWKISSEKFYKEHQQEYYRNINLGINYYELDYNKCIPFLLMLPNSLEEK